MDLSNTLREFAADLRRQKLRSALTILGITWGTVAVVVLLAFGTGMERQMKKNAAGIGDNVAILSGGRTTRAWNGFGEGRRIRLRADDVALLRREVAGIGSISPEFGQWTAVHRGRATSNPWVTGVLPEYGEMRNVHAQAGGRWLNPPDLAGRRRVAVLGDELKQRLFGDEDAVGQQVFIGPTPFTVIGVMVPKQQNSSYQSRDKDRIFVPSTTYQAVFGERDPARIIYQPADNRQAEAVSDAVYQVLGKRYAFDPADRDALSLWDTSRGMKMFTYLFLGFNLFLGVVGSFTLVVGGIGVANIMYIVVRERTREIGVKRALGARRRDILLQVMLETGFIVGIGALLGLLLSVALVRAGALLPLQDQIGTPELSPLVLTVTLLLLGLIALLAGLFPARRAAALDPANALRYGV